MPEISILIPAYNAEGYLPITVESVLAQTFADWECVIVNDGSVDNTGAIADEYARADSRIRVLHQSNQGLPKSRNHGLAESKPEAPYVTFLDADDLWLADTLETLLCKLRSEPLAVAASGTICLIDGEGCVMNGGQVEPWTRTRRGIEGKHVVPWPASRLTDLSVLAIHNVIQVGGIIVRRDALITVGGFDESGDVYGAEDWDMWIRLSRVGGIAFIDKPVLYYRRHGSSMSTNHAKMARSKFAVRRKLLLAVRTDPDLYLTVLIAFCYHYRDHCQGRFRIFISNVLRGQVLAAARSGASAVGAFIRFLKHSMLLRQAGGKQA